MHATIQTNKPAADEVRQQLHAIVQCKRFRSCTRLKRFLTFIVETALTGKDTEVKEYSIALEVFDKPITFDPRKDSDVRVAARQLRLKIDAYYLAEGASDPVLIRLRAGGYVPAFYYRTQKSRDGSGVNSQRSRTVIVADTDAEAARRLIAYVDEVGMAAAWVRSGAELLRYASTETYPVVFTRGELADGMTAETVCSELGSRAAVLAIVPDGAESNMLTRVAQSLPDAILVEPLCPNHVQGQVRLAMARNGIRETEAAHAHQKGAA